MEDQVERLTVLKGVHQSHKVGVFSAHLEDLNFFSDLLHFLEVKFAFLD